jgi:DNA recombination protein RmuC
MEYAVCFVAGLIIGIVLMFFIGRIQKKEIEKTFSSLSRDALSQNASDFLMLANQRLAGQTQAGSQELEGKKQLIDQTLTTMRSDLQNVEKLMKELETDRANKFGELAGQLKSAAEQTSKLQETTGKLQTALANTKIRGQWGERMAEDVLKLAGFIEGINYVKQQTQETTASRPDFTFNLPKDLKLNMDVKFPLDNYIKYSNEEAEPAKQGYKDQFLKDTRQRIKEVTTRDYINPAENTVDYVLIFIPNEQVYCFINENDHAILDEALSKKVILCSPFTLYAILALIRQAVENFKMEKAANEINALMGTFNKQWILFKDSMEKMGKKIEEAQKEYNVLVSTRSNQLERPLNRIEALRIDKGIEISSMEAAESLALLDGPEVGKAEN